jgi:hypothetical protein
MQISKKFHPLPQKFIEIIYFLARNFRCKVDRMDLIIILDASTSREQVFEHQRELALSLIERLPISKDDTHVAVGINSFTSAPTLRQHLGLGRDKLVNANFYIKRYIKIDGPPCH